MWTVGILELNILRPLPRLQRTLCEKKPVGKNTPRSEVTDSGANMDGSGGIEAEATVNQRAMRAAVLKVLSDPAVVRQLVADVSNASSTFSTSASASAHDEKTNFPLIALSN